ncbi:MAG: acyl-CoA/acyl-ACP dehydrogenase [Gammaproteobacteria bacterium]|nr:acyl-CoA/acyl-ACP dehydrogenase [Gammaproteobacteria bacterium]MBT4491848.1 acyl-CoA/acyl-ACP dehydrogenase [Gammaproteobacteria bacterium]MBT7370541.1 acyl-CoA/acyl-ACP dehydrogenase [Gammaproteobacteria bacterium]
MNFDFSDDEKLVQDQISRFLRDNCDLSVCRSVLEGEEAFATAVWQGFSEMGVQGSAIPAAYGGVEAGYLTLCLAALELGKRLAPVPFSSSIYLAAEAVSRYGSDSQKETWLPKLASGELIGTLAVTETVEDVSPGNIETNFSNGVLNGTKLIVPHGLVADIAVVVARCGDELTLVLTELDGSDRRAVDTVDPTMASATIEFKNTDAESLDVSDGWAALEDIYNRAAVLYAFEQIGGAEKALDMAVAYAKERFAFGRPIGSFQALKHMMADMYVALKLAESNCYYAAWALENDSADLPLAAATARVSATQAFQLCSRDNIQVHGGMGFTWEFDCHLYYRRSNFLTVVLGGLSNWENKLVSALPEVA